MRATHLPLASLLAAAALAPAAAIAAGNAAKPATAPPTDAQLIASAVTAAPKKVGQGATVVVAGADGRMRTLRAGTDGFTCMPDNPVTPGPDPMCMDANGMEWVNAWIAHKAPPQGKVGLMYMLAGGTDASNTDPYATAPAAANHWIKTGPHLMIVGADAAFYAGYPRKPDPDTAMPYVMWAGTPYEHLMAVVK